MPLGAPRDARDWMQSVNRQLREVRQGLPQLVGDVTGQVKEEVLTDLNRTPDQPVELSFQTAVYTETTSARRWARVMADFPDVTKATDGTDIEVSTYELWGRDESGNALSSTTSAVPGVAAPGLTFPGLAATPANKAIMAKLTKDWVLLTTSTASALEKDAFLPGSVWRFRIRAIGRGMSVPGQWSDEVVLQMAPDTVPPPQPSQPYLDVTRGSIVVRWDGMSVAGSMPGDFRYLEVAQGESSSPENIVTRFYRGGGVHVASGFDYYTPQFFRFRAVDESGNRSPWSAQSVAYSSPLVDTDVILSKLDAAKTQLVNVDAGVSILSDTIATRHLAVTEEMTAALAEFLHVRAGMIEANAVEADNIQAGAVSAAKLEAVLALVTAIIAGDPLGTHAQMDANGFRVFAADDTDGVPNEVVRMGVAATDDYFAITRSNGTLAATISQDGVGSFTQVNATDAFYYKGTELSTMLGRRDTLVSSAYRTTSSTVNAAAGGGWVPYLRFEATLEANHTYRISSSSIRVDTDLNTTGALGLGNAPSGQLATTSNWGIFVMGHTSPSNGKGTVTLNELWAFPGTPGEKRTISFLLSFGVTLGSGQCGIRAAGDNPARIIIEDLGIPLAGGNGVWLDGTVPPAPARNTYVTQWGANNSASYTGSNAYYNYNTGQMYQGLSPAGYGNLKSIATFNDMTGALSGADINYIRVYFNFNHWYYNSGGTARIGLHGHSGTPGSFSSNGVVVESGGWPKPGARWVDIPSAHWWGFKSGAYRGVTLEGDGGYGTYGYADRPTIEISYTK